MRALVWVCLEIIVFIISRLSYFQWNVFLLLQMRTLSSNMTRSFCFPWQIGVQTPMGHNFSCKCNWNNLLDMSHGPANTWGIFCVRQICNQMGLWCKIFYSGNFLTKKKKRERKLRALLYCNVSIYINPVLGPSYTQMIATQSFSQVFALPPIKSLL